jgi:hypothetical protein
MEENNWAKCFAVVTFDEDIGQTLETSYPAVLTEEQQRSICFLAFPDSNSFSSTGDLMYLFRMSKDHDSLFGHVYFRQRKDSTKPRGYFQKSLVIVTHLPYATLFRQVAQIVGPLYFDYGANVFEAAWHAFSTWPNPTAGISLELPMMGSVIYYTLPSATESESAHLLSEGLATILDSINQGLSGFFQDVNIYEALGPEVCKKHLWKLWEIVITGEPLIVLSDQPWICSIAVLALVSMISPVEYSGDYRPYFTIFDPDFRDIQSACEGNVIGSVILGVTNPLFMKVMNHWPNVINLEVCDDSVTCTSFQKKIAGNITPTKPIIAQLLQGNTKETNAINNSILRRHFRELTLSFLHPFQQYYTLNTASLLKDPYSQKPNFKAFTESDFLRDLSDTYNLFPFLKYTSRPKALNIYTKFLQSSCFRSWFASQRQKASSEAHLLIQRAIVNFDVLSVLNELDAPKCRTLYKKIETQLKYEQTRGDNPDAIQKLKRQLSILLSKMTGSREEDLQTVFS